jgi:hypothetical protein
MVCDRLQCPSLESWQSSEKELKAAIACLSELEHSLRSNSAARQCSRMLAAEVAGIRRELDQAQALLAAAGKFYQGWARLMGCAEIDAPNYAPGGAAAPVASIHGPQVVVHG